MLPHKEQPTSSLPTSRVSSSARLNLLATPGLSKTLSRPGTPGAYVASSLNPSKNAPVTVSSPVSNGETAKHESRSLLENVEKFDATLNKLALDVASYERGSMVEHVQNLIDINDKITSGMKELEEHRNLGEQAQELKKKNNDLDLQSKHILRELISYRAQLKQLPSLPASKDQTIETLRSVDVKTLIEYSMKLAKFSKTPATVQSPFIHPNNFVWPAEDALRRGMLAMASLKPDDLIAAELGAAQKSSSDVEMKDVGSGENEYEKEGAREETGKDISSEPRSVPKPDAKPKPKEAPAKPASLDLDLFDSDQDDSD